MIQSEQCAHILFSPNALEYKILFKPIFIYTGLGLVVNIALHQRFSLYPGLKERQAKEIERLGEEHKTSVKNIEEKLNKEKHEEMNKCKH